jgi:hypothetical protein
LFFFRNATGAHAANMLALSDQVPMKIVYLTDGPSRRATVGHELHDDLVLAAAQARELRVEVCLTNVYTIV